MKESTSSANLNDTAGALKAPFSYITHLECGRCREHTKHQSLRGFVPAVLLCWLATISARCARL